MANTIQIDTVDFGPQYMNLPDNANVTIEFNGNITGDLCKDYRIALNGSTTYTVVRYIAENADITWWQRHAAAYMLIAAFPAEFGYPTLGIPADEYYKRDVRLTMEPVINAALGLDDPQLGTEILAVATVTDTNVVGEGGEYNLEELENIINKGKDAAQVLREETIVKCLDQMLDDPCNPFGDCDCNDTQAEIEQCCQSAGQKAYDDAVKALLESLGAEVVKKHEYIYAAVSAGGPAEKS